MSMSMEPMKIAMDDMVSLREYKGEPMNVTTKSYMSIEKRLKIVKAMVKHHEWLTEPLLNALFPKERIVTFSKRQWELMAFEARSILNQIKEYLH